MTDRIRVTIACPEALMADANELGRVLGESAADGEAYRAADHADPEGERYAAPSALVSPAFVTAATSPLVEPDWGADMAAAARAQALVVIGDPAAPETCRARPDRIVAVFHPDAREARALMGLARIEEDEP